MALPPEAFVKYSERRRLDCAARARAYYAQRRAEGMPAKQSSKRRPCDSCGKSLSVTAKSRPDPVCRDCRRAARQRVCTACGKGYESLSAESRYCSIACANRHKDGLRPAHASANERYAAKCRARRARARGNGVEPYSLADVIAKSGRTCGICGNPVNIKLSGLDKWGPTVDHILPISHGGPDTLANVQLAHRHCNVRKSNKLDLL